MPPAGSTAVRRLRRVAVGVVAAAFLAAGASKLLRPDAGVSMVDRYLTSPRAVRAGACLEIALALWLLSGRSPVLAPATAAAALAGLGLLAGVEARRDRPLPCGCFPARVAPAGDAAATRRGLRLAVARNAFLVALCAAATVRPSDARPGPPA